MKKQRTIKDEKHPIFWAILLCYGCMLLNGGWFLFFSEFPKTIFSVIEFFFLISIGVAFLKYFSLTNGRSGFCNLPKRTMDLELFLRDMPSGIFGVDKAGGIVYVNSFAERIAGYKEKEVLGKWLGDVLIFYDRAGAEVLNLFKKFRSLKGPVHFSSINVASKSGHKYVISGYVFSLVCNLKINVFIVFSDMAEEQKKRSVDRSFELLEKRYNVLHDVFSNLPFGVLVSEISTSEVIYANRMFRKIHDLPDTDPVLKSTLFKILSTNIEYRQIVSLSNQKINPNNNRFLWLDMRIYDADGYERIISVNNHICPELDLKITSVLYEPQKCQRKRFTKEMVLDFKWIMENSIDGLIISDQKGVIVKYSDSMSLITGLNRFEAVGKPLWLVEEDVTKDEIERRNEFVRIASSFYSTNESRSQRWVEIKMMRNVLNNCVNMLEVTSKIIVHDNNIRVYKIYKNINNLIAKEKRQRFQNAFVKQLVSSSFKNLYIFDYNENKFTFTSSVSQDYKAEQIIGFEDKTVQSDNVHPDDVFLLKEYKQSLKELKNGMVGSFVFRVKLSSSWKYLWRRDMVFSRFENGFVREILGTLTDVTEVFNSDRLVSLTKNR